VVLWRCDGDGGVCDGRGGGSVMHDTKIRVTSIRLFTTLTVDWTVLVILWAGGVIAQARAKATKILCSENPIRIFPWSARTMKRASDSRADTNNLLINPIFLPRDYKTAMILWGFHALDDGTRNWHENLGGGGSWKGKSIVSWCRMSTLSTFLKSTETNSDGQAFKPYVLLFQPHWGKCDIKNAKIAQKYYPLAPSSVIKIHMIQRNIKGYEHFIL
jgi:hypothetical protein